MSRAVFIFGSLVAAACGSAQKKPDSAATASLVAEAKQFVADMDPQLRKLVVDASLASWANETDITDAHEAAEAKATAIQNAGVTKLVKQAQKFTPVMDALDPDTRRELKLLPLLASGAPDDPARADELTRVATEMKSRYGKGVCTTSGGKEKCLDIEHWSKIIETSRDPAELLAAWRGWHDGVGHATRELFVKYVALANEGARAIGYRDVAAQWRSGYDMPEAKFTAEVDRLWKQVKPLYDQLHCYARRRLNARFGDAVVPKTGPIPAHLLGNMWAQSWEHLYPELEPYAGVASIDVSSELAAHHDAIAMVKMGEAFYTSLGMDPLPETFWQRSQFVKPEGRDVVCHASSWDVQYNDDLRIKMCIKPTQEDLETIHHELGHSYYFQHYYKLPVIYQNGANDGFHEAIGDTIQLSMTPEYLHAKGLLARADKNDKATINHQMAVALKKIAFLPFGLLVDKWRWDVFSGAVPPERYNQHWWDLKREYQGIAPPVARSEADFDPGAKYHVAANVPYMRYFLAAVLQFQFHRALCKIAGSYPGRPLHECSIYGNKAAGAAYAKMLALGQSVPWQDALEVLTGQRDMDASAILEYFGPLQKWLEEQNRGQTCGW